jgi:hypothetical protein
MLRSFRIAIATALVAADKKAVGKAAVLAKQLDKELHSASNRELLGAALDSSQTLARDLVVATVSGAAAGVATLTGCALLPTIGIGVGTAFVAETINIASTRPGRHLLSRALTPKNSPLPMDDTHGIPEDRTNNPTI